MKYMGLEDLVPPFVLCTAILAKQFKNSALVWVKYPSGELLVMPREIAIRQKQGKVYPAPTLQEIFMEIPSPSRVGVSLWETFWLERAINEWFFYRRENDKPN